MRESEQLLLENIGDAGFVGVSSLDRLSAARARAE
jgi:hypothetical protein